jgi:hypothetical protein
MARITAKRYIAYSPPLFPAQVIAPTSANAGTLCGNNVKIRRSGRRAPAPRRAAAKLGEMNESLGMISHNSNCNCTGCGMLRAGVCINCRSVAAGKAARLFVTCSEFRYCPPTAMA